MVKILLLFLLLAIGIAVYFSANEDKDSTIELTDEVSEMQLMQDAQPEVESSIGSNAITQAIDENAPALVGSSSKELLQSELMTTATTELSKDIVGIYDPNAIAPEDESVQNVYDDAMQVSESDDIAPEAGSEMMPDGDGIPMISEPIEKTNAPKSMDEVES